MIFVCKWWNFIFDQKCAKNKINTNSWNNFNVRSSKTMSLFDNMQLNLRFTTLFSWFRSMTECENEQKKVCVEFKSTRLIEKRTSLTHSHSLLRLSNKLCYISSWLFTFVVLVAFGLVSFTPPYDCMPYTIYNTLEPIDFAFEKFGVS